MSDFDEMETIADSVRIGKGRIIRDYQKRGLETACKSSSQTRAVDLKPGNRLRLSAHMPSLPKLKFMQGD